MGYEMQWYCRNVFIRWMSFIQTVETVLFVISFS